MTQPTCHTCRAFSAMTSECRRHAPTMVPVQVPTRTELGNPSGTSMQAMGMFPATNKDRWCAEYLGGQEAFVPAP